MIRQLILPFLFLGLFLGLIISCEKDEDSNNIPPPPPVISRSFIEEFDTVANLAQKGWVIQNNSHPFGPTAWRQGKYELGGKIGNTVVGFPAYSAVYNQNEFISVDLNAGSGAAQISCWLVTRPIRMKNGDEFSFYTRTKGEFVDRLQVRANFTTGSANVGSSPTDVGDFTTLLLDINEGMTLPGYPKVWTKYTIPLAGLPGGLINGRIAFRYYVPNGGPNGNDSDMIGIDKFEFTAKD